MCSGTEVSEDRSDYTSSDQFLVHNNIAKVGVVDCVGLKMIFFQMGMASPNGKWQIFWGRTCSGEYILCYEGLLCGFSHITLGRHVDNCSELRGSVDCVWSHWWNSAHFPCHLHLLLLPSMQSALPCTPVN